MKKPILVGAHMSAAGGVHNALLRGHKIGCTTIQLFTTNQKQWKGRPLTAEDIDLWDKAMDETGMQEVMSHDSYLINLGSPKPEGLEKSRKAFQEEVDRCLALGITYLNFHPGSALDGTDEQCIDRIAESLLLCEKQLQDGPTTLLLEATAGQGSNVGHRFEHLGAVIEQVKDRIPIGVCIDTCHIFAAGYDIRDKKGWDRTLKEFDEAVGLEYLRAFHLNDSLKELGSRRDRHANLGKGEIGIECFKVLMSHPKIRHLPKYLETPNGDELWESEIKLLHKFARK